ncbi:hypothetical protein [Leptolyngbya sp. FACHB-8]|uniref:hypothetical protein n=1 Tax=Leptolyngbya sp. FACHB-8 TaxID=2692814 RepID=UPI001A7E54E9|nr:hypothetical protein [Leptolyngbya sp. FACHB-8]
MTYSPYFWLQSHLLWEQVALPPLPQKELQVVKCKVLRAKEISSNEITPQDVGVLPAKRAKHQHPG